MKIKGIIENYKDLEKWAELICFKDTNTVALRGLLDEISIIEDEVINKYGDMRISLKNELYLKYIFSDLETIKSELYIVILERDGQGFSFWTDLKEKSEYRKLRCTNALRKLEEKNNEKSHNDM